MHYESKDRLLIILFSFSIAWAAPVITEETTASIETIIKQRILDQAWDDVERKIKPKEEAFEFKKRITLDQEKSKLSLGEIYEQEYLKKMQVIVMEMLLEENICRGWIDRVVSLYLIYVLIFEECSWKKFNKSSQPSRYFKPDVLFHPAQEIIPSFMISNISSWFLALMLLFL